MTTTKEAFNSTITVQPASNGGFVVHRSMRIGEFADCLAFTNRADLLAWITGELAPTPAAAPVTGDDGWQTFNEHRDGRPEGVVDVIYQNEMMVKNCDTTTVNWGDVTHWKPSTPADAPVPTTTAGQMAMMDDEDETRYAARIDYGHGDVRYGFWSPWKTVK